MNNFVAIDFETGNPKRVSACSIGYALVKDNCIIESNEYLIKPIGGHATFQTRIHGIKESDTRNKPMFDKIYSDIKYLFEQPLVAYSMFDLQVLNALSDHFKLNLVMDYIDTCQIAKIKYPDLKNHKLTTLVEYFKLPKFNHHNAKEDAIVCAKVFLLLNEGNLSGSKIADKDNKILLRDLVKDILSDEEVDYKEAYELLYWLEDHLNISKQYINLYNELKNVLEDNILDFEEIKILNAEYFVQQRLASSGAYAPSPKLAHSCEVNVGFKSYY